MTQYVSVGEGQIAFQVCGEGDLVLAFVSPFSDVEARWDVPPLARMLDRMASYSRLILFDRRGTGMSDPVDLAGLATWESWADDLRTVLDAARCERVVLLAEFQAGAWALLFAATFPERTQSLVLWNSFARSLADDDYPHGMPKDAVDGLTDVMAATWGTRQASLFVDPSLADDEAALDALARLQRSSCTPLTFARLARYEYDLDARHILGGVRAPTLVLHRSGALGGPAPELGRYVADGVADASFVLVPGRDVDLWAEGADEIGDLIEEFVTGAPAGATSERVLATVLFTDIVGSTERAVALGDRRWTELLRAHDALVRTQLERYRGREIDSAGDGFFATFDGPARAIRCACAIRDHVRALGIDIRAGLHTGEITFDGKEASGIAVHIGARVSALAGPGDVLVSRTVKDLVAGAGLQFEDRGEHRLKGVPDEWRVFAVQR